MLPPGQSPIIPRVGGEGKSCHPGEGRPGQGWPPAPRVSSEGYPVNFPQSLTLSYVSSGVFYRGVSVYIRKESKTESVPVVGGVCEAVDEHAARGGLERLPHSVIQFVVGH